MDIKLQDVCVIKLLQRLDPGMDEQFHREARALHLLNTQELHIHVPRLYNYFSKFKPAFLVEEYIPGFPLKRAPKMGIHTTISYCNNLRLITDIKEAIFLLHSILLILKEVHQLDILHRDINPNSIH